MPDSLRRRLIAGTVLSLSLGTVVAAPAVVPVIWDGKKMWETFEAEAKGFAFAHQPDAPKAYVTFDSQCPDCVRFYERVKPLLSKVNLIWCPIAFLNIHSEPQGASILAAAHPEMKFLEQHELFRDPNFRGFKYNPSEIPIEKRNDVWTNTKLSRRAGCRAVPYGVFKTKDGKYLPFDENLTTKELAQVFGIEWR